MALAYHLDALYEEIVGRVLGDVDREAWLQLVQLLLNLQNHVRQVVRRTLSLAVYATYINIGEVVVGSALQRCHAHLRRCRLVIELDPQAGEQFLGLVACQRAVGQSLLIERPQVLVYMAGIHGVPAVQLGHGAEVHEPVHLYGLPQVARGMGGNPAADRGNLAKLGDSLLPDGHSGFSGFSGISGISGGQLLGHLLCQLCVPLGKEDGCIARDGHGF